MILLLAHDHICKNLSVPPDPGCSGITDFPYSPHTHNIFNIYVCMYVCIYACNYRVPLE